MNSVKDNNYKMNYIRVANLLLKHKNVYVDVTWTNKKGSYIPDDNAYQYMLDEKADYTVYEDAAKKKKLFKFDFVPGKKSTVTLDNGDSLQLGMLKSAILARKLLKIRSAGLSYVVDDLKKETTSKGRLLLESVTEALRM